MQLKKIVIIGPESTGKSSLCEKLAQHYQTKWVPEYARAYLLENGMKYTEQDLLLIAKGQLALEDHFTDLVQKQLPVPPVLFIDTNMYVMKVWSEFVFKNADPWITKQLPLRKYQLYLLCNIDLPWIKDELREYPDLNTRKELYNIYKKLLESQPAPWVDISGNYQERFQKAIIAVDSLLSGSLSEI
jgi:NadR type nicotinamide-nucleotide adenylyltransferase